MSATGEAGRDLPAPMASQGGATLPAADTPPEGIVQAFLEASRGGKDDYAAQLLSEKAQDAAERAGLVLDPPGTPSMKFTLGAVEFPVEEPLAAYVTSRWQETEGDGQESFEVVWILRKQATGWRIAGMASREDAQATPTLINFEDVNDLSRIKNEVAGEPLTEGDALSTEGSPEPPATSVGGRKAVQDHTARRPAGSTR